MSEDIQVGDKTYVSSKRASDISGYAQDYIGQLARGGHIDAKRIGGLWYLHMKSLESYKVGSGEVVAEKKDDQLTSLPDAQKQDSSLSFDGKEYISAKRASKLTGYNQDYVGQLARSGKILSRQVGNRWFVDHEGILAHKNEKDSLLAAVQTESVGVYQEVSKSSEVDSSAASIHEHELLNYMTDEGHLIPQIRETSQWEPEAAIRDKPITSRHINQNQYEIEEENEVPIHVIKRPAFNVRRRPSYAFKPKKDIRHARKARIPLSVGVLILSLILIGSLGSVLFISGSSMQEGIQGGLSMTANVITSTSAIAVNKIATTFEGLIDPELIYNRSN